MKQNESEVKVEAGDRKNGLRLELATGQANSHSLTTLTTILALDGIALLFFIRNTQRTRKRNQKIQFRELDAMPDSKRRKMGLPTKIQKVDVVMDETENRVEDIETTVFV